MMGEKTCETGLTVRPATLREANALVADIHRHHPPVRGSKFALKLVDADGRTRGALIAGRPVARNLDNGLTLEVNRLATDGTYNACSMLYGAARRVAKAMGYTKIITYTLPEEGGASLRASNWALAGTTDGGSWSRAARTRVDKAPTSVKHRWEIRL
jgi:hypothetical protein